MVSKFYKLNQSSERTVFMNKYKTKECHRCGYTIIQSTNSLNGKPDKNDANMLLSLCPFCNEVFFDGEIEGVAGCKTILENQIYAQYIFGHPEKEKLYQERINGKPVRTPKEIAEREKAKAERQKRVQEYKKAANSHIPKCPICGSTNLKKLSFTNKVISVGVFGLLSNKINKTWECKNCKSTF